MTDTTFKTPWHLWAVGMLAVLFNGVGAFDHAMKLAQGAAYLESAGMTPAQIAYYQELPAWMQLVWATGVWSAMLGSVFILARRHWAFPVFAVSLTAFALNLFYMYILSAGGAIMGPPMMIASVVITAFLVFFLWYARAMARWACCANL